MDATLTSIAFHQVQGEITGLISSKEHKLDELAGCINAILRHPSVPWHKLLTQRNRLEDDILELSLIIRLKQYELNRVRRMGNAPQTPAIDPGLISAFSLASPFPSCLSAFHPPASVVRSSRMDPNAAVIQLLKPRLKRCENSIN